MIRSLFVLAALSLLSLSAQAGDAIFRATGVVAGGSASSGPFAGTTVGSAVTVTFEVFNAPPMPIASGYDSYPVDNPTFLLTIGSNSATTSSSTLRVGMANAFPVSDGVYLDGVPLTGGGAFAFSFGAPGSLFANTPPPPSTRPLDNLGSWSGFFYTSFSFMVQGPGVFLDLNLLTFSISVPETGTPVCAGDGSATACPCGNHSPVGQNAGCLSSITLGGKLRGQGAASVSADALVLHATQVPNGPGLFFQGTSLLGVGFGDGLLCASGTITRMGVVFASGNASDYPGGSTPGPISVVGGVAPSDVRLYQVWYRDADVNFCTPAVYNLTNAVQVTWGS